jgi:hypothetical protein
MTFQIENPKRFVSANKASCGWVDYYAGYSNHFAKMLLESSNLRPLGVVVDPWNGSGTTTEIASILGFKGYGFDVNPAMLLLPKPTTSLVTMPPSGRRIFQLTDVSATEEYIRALTSTIMATSGSLSMTFASLPVRIIDRSHWISWALIL